MSAKPRTAKQLNADLIRLRKKLITLHHTAAIALALHEGGKDKIIEDMHPIHTLSGVWNEYLATLDDIAALAAQQSMPDGSVKGGKGGKGRKGDTFGTSRSEQPREETVSVEGD